jgi:Spy/CpxP family protein refolding chaperone
MENSKTRREAALLVIVVFLLGALVGGLATHVWSIHAAARGIPHGPDQLIDQLSRELQLSPDQLKQVTEIVDEAHTQMRALYAPIDAQREQIRKQARERMRAVLTPDQKVKFEDFMRHLDEGRNKEERR